MDGRPFTVLALDGRLQVDGETTDTHAASLECDRTGFSSAEEPHRGR
jgi:hypothetical protein